MTIKKLSKRGTLNKEKEKILLAKLEELNAKIEQYTSIQINNEYFLIDKDLDLLFKENCKEIE